MIMAIGLLAPLWAVLYILAPKSLFGNLMRKPFIKFIVHSASYCIFLCKWSYIIIEINLTYLFISWVWYTSNMELPTPSRRRAALYRTQKRYRWKVQCSICSGWFSDSHNAGKKLWIKINSKSWKGLPAIHSFTNLKFSVIVLPYLVCTTIFGTGDTDQLVFRPYNTTL